MDGPKAFDPGCTSAGPRWALSACLLAVCLTACAQIPSKAAAVVPSASEPSAMSSSETFKPRLASDYPDVTPEEMGRRFLKLVDGIRSVEELSLEKVIRETGLPLQPVPNGELHAFVLHQPETGWHYGLDYFAGASAAYRTVMLDFANPSNPTADRSPVCSMDLAAYSDALNKMGFTVSGLRDEVGRLTEYHYYRDKLDVLVMYEPQARTPESKASRFCVSRISVHAAG